MSALDVGPLSREVRLNDFSRIEAVITFGLVRKEVINFASGTVVCNNIEAFIVHVKDQILTLYSPQHE